MTREELQSMIDDNKHRLHILEMTGRKDTIRYLDLLSEIQHYQNAINADIENERDNPNQKT